MGKSDFWNGKELTWSSQRDIRQALDEKSLPIDTPLAGAKAANVKKYKGSGWKVLLAKEDQSEFILYKKIKAN